MSGLGPLGISTMRPPSRARGGIELVVTRPTLRRIMEHTGFDIDDVVDSPIAKHAVLGYYKLYRTIERRCEVLELERQWNPL